MNTNELMPVAIIGGGPVGLAAAARLVERGLTPLLFERGSTAGSSIANWSHVRVFSPWRYNIDVAARELLKKADWREPDPDHLPTGGELIRDYLEPLATHPSISPHLHLEAEVVAISRQNHSKLTSEGREESPFVIVWRDRKGIRHRGMARAVIDASGTWTRPNPIGLDGLPVEGEVENGGRIAYGIPDVKGAQRADYEATHTLVVGAGHSAINAVLDLMDLQEYAPETRITWATRQGGIARLLGGGLNDALPGRGMLGLRAAEAIRSGRVDLISPLSIQSIAETTGRLRVAAFQESEGVELLADRIIVAAGFRPDLTLLGELRLSLDPIVEATPALAPLIDPNLHSCGTVRPHGVVELSHPEKNFFIAGSKSYGRAPTFLMATGYEQVRSIVAELAGDHVAARQVQLELPETGVCNSGIPERPSTTVTLPTDEVSSCCGDGQRADKNSSCCGGAPIENQDACCLKDEQAKAQGETGCGCDSGTPSEIQVPA